MLALALVAFALLAGGATATPTTVTTTLGPVQGVETEQAVIFRGLRYGLKPDRFQPSVPPTTPWTEPFVADTDPKACMQSCTANVTLPPYMCPAADNMDEDCLKLNIYGPQGADTADAPVLVFIHGGNFRTGSESILYDGSLIANETGSIVVVIQYRLGVLGTLYAPSADPPAPGNMMLQDQRLAMQWIQDNIAAFGGDPGRVTLFGQSAGAMSIASHMVMDSADGLFQQAIMESEPFSLPFREADDAEAFGLTFAKKAGCTKGTLKKSLDMDCLLALSDEDLLAAQDAAAGDIPAELAHLLELFQPFTATTGIDEFPLHPMEAFQQGLNQDKPFMIGTVAQEGLEFVAGAFPTGMSTAETKLGVALVYGEAAAEAIFNEFPMPEADDQTEYVSDLMTASLFECATRNATHMAKRSSGSWIYKFDHPMSFGAAAWGPNFEECDNETCHGGELPFVFQPTAAASLGFVYTDDELSLCKSLRTYWANFAASGDPGTDQNGMAWPQWSPDDGMQSMYFQTPANSIVSALDADLCDFWDSSVGFNYP